MTGAFSLSERKTSRRLEPVLPMVNLVFLLLIFFLMTAIIAPHPPLEVREPEAGGAAGFEPASLRVAVAPDGTVHFGNSTGAAALDELTVALEGASGRLPVVIHADGAAPALAVVRLNAALSQLVYDPVWLVAEPAR